jgi:hypothetical protein
MKYSVTYGGIVVLFVSNILKAAGVEIGSEELTPFIFTGLDILGGLVAAYGRWRQGDISLLGVKK